MYWDWEIAQWHTKRGPGKINVFMDFFLTFSWYSCIHIWLYACNTHVCLRDWTQVTLGTKCLSYSTFLCHWSRSLSWKISYESIKKKPMAGLEIWKKEKVNLCLESLWIITLAKLTEIPVAYAYIPSIRWNKDLEVMLDYTKSLIQWLTI